MSRSTEKLPKLGFFYLDHVLRFFDQSNFPHWPEPIETVIYHWTGDEQRFIQEIKNKGIDILIGNVPATAYNTFLQIKEALPGVTFLPSLEAQFCNRSKENVTRFCWKHGFPIPETHIFNNTVEGLGFLENCAYPRIIKRSYGPSNYGGYYVHKVDSAPEALQLITQKRYNPIYIQECIPLEADIRVMLVGHQPVCAFWRRPKSGGWLTNTSQGGEMDYRGVPPDVLELGASVSRAAGAEYWGIDIAFTENRLAILECATAFAAFPYIRDWIGGFLSWKLSHGRLARPHIPAYNWEELGKVNASLLRTMRHITFSEHVAPHLGVGP